MNPISMWQAIGKCQKIGELFKSSYACCACSCNVTCRLFPQHISASLCHKSRILQWQLLLYNSCRQSRKATGWKILLYVAFTVNQGSLLQLGRILPMNFTNAAQVCFNSVQFYDPVISFQFHSGCKTIFCSSFCLYLQNVVRYII